MYGLIEKSIKAEQTQSVLVNNNKYIRIGCYIEEQRLIVIREYRKKNTRNILYKSIYMSLDLQESTGRTCTVLKRERAPCA